MLAFLYNNVTVIVFIVVMLVLTLMYFHFKSLPAKVKKKEEKKEEKQEPAIKEEEKPAEVVETKQEEIIDEEKGKARNSKVSHIYKRPATETVKETVSLGKESEYDAEFVNVSKNVSRFKGLVAKEEELKELVNEAETNEFGFVTDKQEDCDFCESKTSHFDHSRRLSKFVKDQNFDGMFASHISDYYMNMDGYGRHLRVDDDKLGKLYEKADKTIENSERKLSSGVVEKSIIQSDIENMQEVVTDEELKSIADLRTVVITDSIMNRKKKK